MYILGISCFYHDAAATLLKDGVVVAAAQEERFSRVKHDNSFPFRAIRYCLESQNITMDDIAYVGFYEKPFLKWERLLSQHIDMFPKSFRIFICSLPAWLTERLRIPKLIQKKLNYKGEVLFVEHHLAHAASAFLVSPFKKATIVTVDGVGEWTTTSYGYGSDNEIRLLKEIRFPSSLGLLYSTITAYLGFKVNSDEYKAMGLSAYGDKTKNPYYARLKKVIDVNEDGSYQLDMDYFVYHFRDRMFSKKLCVLLGGSPRKPESNLENRHKDIAAAVQLILEEVMVKILCQAHKVTKCSNVVLAGGVALNSVFNGKILQLTPFKRVWVQPDATDGGGSLGVSSYICHVLLGKPRKYVMDSAFLGPGFSDEEVQGVLDQHKVRYHRFTSQDELISTTAKLIFENNVVGWFQGRMEWGPRALGARSILANPCNPKMKDIVNKKVKHREPFRPFAPVICREDASKYFEVDPLLSDATDFRLFVYPIKKPYRQRIPAVTHVDGTGRLQTLRREQHPLFYALVKEFGKLSGVPVLLNTSFNVRGEPIVCMPLDAYKCMMGTQIDCLVMGSFLVWRKENLNKRTKFQDHGE